MSAAAQWRVAATAATAGAFAFVLLAAGCLWSGLDYGGTAGAYSPLNHWISELGQPGVAARATAFNVLVTLSGAAFTVFVIGLVLTWETPIRWLFGVLGVLAGVGGALVGVFPMDHPTQHVAAASLFFVGESSFVVVASLAFLRRADPAHPRWLAVPGFIGAGLGSAFIASLRLDSFARERMAFEGPITGRPDVWIAPILEWAALAGIMVWVLLTSLAWWRQLRREAGVSALARAGAR